MMPGTHFTNALYAHNPNLVKIRYFYLKNNTHVKLQICACHNSLAVVTYVQNCVKIVSLVSKLEHTEEFNW